MKRSIAVVVLTVLAMVPGLLTAQDTSKRVELQLYMLGDAPKDLPVVAAEINKLALKELNATVKFNYISWTNWDQKYNLLLASGQPVDLLYSSNWASYGKYAEQGAFLPLDGLIQKAAPALYKFVPQDSWKAASVNGKLYGIPSTWKEYTSEGVVWREDLRKKYNLPIPNSVENIEAFCDGIRKYEPDMTPILPDASVGMAADSVMQFKYPGSIYAPATNQFPFYGMRFNANKPSELIEYFGSPDFLADAKVYKRWADKGFWPKGALSQSYPEDGIVKGQFAMVVSGNNPNKWAASQQTLRGTHPDWSLGWYAYGQVPGGVLQPAHPTQNMFVVPRSAKNPERALMFYQKLVMDKRYNQLSEYGIEGKHYRVTPDGYYENLDPKNTRFDREAMGGWAWRNPEFSLYERSFSQVLDLFKEYDKTSTPNFLAGFSEDPTPYQAELAAYKQVWTQYGAPIISGFAGDPQQAIDTFLKKAKEAGLDKIRAQMKKQWLAFVAANNLK